METKELYEKLRHVAIGGTVCQYSMETCEKFIPIINEINELKREKNAVILAHSYVNPEIIYGVSDYSGDSYQLSLDAKKTDADIIIFSAVKFMAETAKILNPQKEVYIPNELNGCSLADSITGEDVRKLKEDNPDYTFVCYINTTADVKAECDVCVTSSNVYTIIENIPNDKIYFVPDKLMGINIQDEMKRRGVKKDIKLYDGTCYVHEEYDKDMISYLRLKHEGIKVISHPECNSGVVGASDYVGSTSGLMSYVKGHPDSTFLMLTECGLTGRLQVEYPGSRFVGSCTLCKYMKDNSLQNILQALKDPKPFQHIEVADEVRDGALACIEKMFEYAGTPATKTN